MNSHERRRVICFSENVSSARISQALNLLLTSNKARFERREIAGKSVEVWTEA